MKNIGILKAVNNHNRELSLEREADLEAGGGGNWMFALKSTFKLEVHLLCFPGLCWHKMRKSIFETNPRRSELKKINVISKSVKECGTWGRFSSSSAETCLSIHTNDFSIKSPLDFICLCKLFKIGPVSCLCK